MKEISKIIFLSIVFTVVIFFINYSFFGDKEVENNIAEEKYIEPEIKTNINKEELIKKINNLNLKQKEKIRQFYKNKFSKKYFISYIPKLYKNEINIFEENIIKILEKNLFKDKITKLEIRLIKEKIDRRGKMKNKSVNLFGINNKNQTEYLAVFIHEFAHYIDLYFLEKKVFLDISTKFYRISWNSTKIKKEKQTIKDFVSGYSMTNKYEDFAETFTYYVLHNKDFLEKTKTSKILKQKYDFFSNYIFKNKEFFATNFIENSEIKNYYRDITKIDYNPKKLFKYLENIN